MPAPHFHAADVRVVFDRAVEQVLVHAGEIPPLVNLADSRSRMALAILGMDRIQGGASFAVCAVYGARLALAAFRRVLHPPQHVLLPALDFGDGAPRAALLFFVA